MEGFSKEKLALDTSKATQRGDVLTKIIKENKFPHFFYFSSRKL